MAIENIIAKESKGDDTSSSVTGAQRFGSSRSISMRHWLLQKAQDVFIAAKEASTVPAGASDTKTPLGRLLTGRIAQRAKCSEQSPSHRMGSQRNPKLSDDWVRQIFSDHPRVLRSGSSEPRLNKEKGKFTRQYVSLRIPEASW